MSPISSRNSVPPSAISKRPLRVVIAPVNEPFLVAEQLALEQLGGNRAAVHGDEGAMTARACCMNGPRSNLFTSTGFP
jgi:hypothetical protein